MDHTPVDDWTVLDTATFLPLGRPFLTVAIDVATRMVLGHVLTFEPPSLYSVMATLKRVNREKSYISDLYPDIRERTDAWGKPDALLVDNGWEFKAPSLQDALHDLGTEIIWAPIHDPEYKAIGERFFRTLNTSVFHKLRGGVPYDPKTMRQVGLDPKKDAVITLGDLDEVIHQFDIEVYQFEKHDGLGAIPARIWEEKIAIHKRPFIGDIRALNSLLGRLDTATLQRDGIEFKCMRFHDDRITSFLLDDLMRFEKKRSQSGKTFSSARARVKIKYNPIDASSIEVWNHGGEPHPHYVTLPNADPKFFKGLSFWHWDRIREYAAKQDLAFRSDDDRWAARNRLRETWERLAGMMPMRESRDARRGLSYLQQADDNITEDPPVDVEITAENIVHGRAESSMEGRAQAIYGHCSEDIVAAHGRTDDGAAPKGKPPSQASVRKAARTRAAKAQAAADNAKQAEERKRKGNPTGTPVTDASFTPRQTGFEDLPEGDGWDPPDESQSTETPTAKPTNDDSLASCPGWDD